MIKTNYTLASTYRNHSLHFESETIPETSFRSCPGEEHVYEEHAWKASQYQIEEAFTNGTITALDKQALAVMGKFASGYLTTKQLRELLTMAGVLFSEAMYQSSLFRLHRYGLINFSYCKSPQFVRTFRILSLTQYGSRAAKNLSGNHRYNGVAMATAQVCDVKSALAAAQVVVQFLKHFPALTEFHMRPVLNPDEGKIVRPAANLKLEDEYIHIETPRRATVNYLEDIKDKFHRYGLCFEGKTPPNIIICGEDEEMNREIFACLQEMKTDSTLFFTTDLDLFGKRFPYALYQFDENGEKKQFRIAA